MPALSGGWIKGVGIAVSRTVGTLWNLLMYLGVILTTPSRLQLSFGIV